MAKPKSVVKQTIEPKPKQKNQVVKNKTSSPVVKIQPSKANVTKNSTKVVQAPVQAPESKQKPAGEQSEQRAGFGDRLVSELFYGGLIGAGGGLLGGVVAWQISNKIFGAEAQVKTFAIISGTYVGSAVLMPLGIYTGGQLKGGQGSLLFTMGLSLATTGGALLYALDDETGTGTALTVLALAPLVGSFLGYELSHAIWHDIDQNTASKDTETFRVQFGLMPLDRGIGASAFGEF